jgi:hypothetical protein
MTILFILLFAGTMLFGAVFGDVPEASSMPKSRLIKIDLLSQERPGLRLPGRNIFLPISLQPAREELDSDEWPIEDIQDPAGHTGLEPDALSSFELRYLGYVRSGESIVALVVFNGEVLAVKAGDVLSYSVRVLDITLDEITVTVDDSSSESFSIEGDRL